MPYFPTCRGAQFARVYRCVVTMNLCTCDPVLHHFFTINLSGTGEVTNKLVAVFLQ
jgi:hypothetical protein